MEESRLSRSVAETLATDPDSSPVRRAIEAERRNILRSCILKLTGRQALLVILRYEKDCTFAEIAECFEVSEVTVWKMHQRILRVLLCELAGRNVLALKDLL